MSTIFLWRAWVVTPRLVRAMVLAPLYEPRLQAVRQEEPPYFLGVLVGHHFHAPALLAHVGRTLGHAVTLVGRLELHLAGRGQREALLGAALGLHLGHFASFKLWLLIGGLGMPY